MKRLYYVHHKGDGRGNGVEMLLDENRVKRAQNFKGKGRNNDDGKFIACEFRRITRRISFVYFSSLTIKLIGEPKQQTQSSSQQDYIPGNSFAHNTRGLSYCEKDYCLYCENGKYEECPNNKNRN